MTFIFINVYNFWQVKLFIILLVKWKAEWTEIKSCRHSSLLLLRYIPGRLKPCKTLPDDSDETTSYFCQGHSVLFCYLCEWLCPASEVVLSNIVGSHLKKNVQEIQATILKDYLEKKLRAQGKTFIQLCGYLYKSQNTKKKKLRVFISNQQVHSTSTSPICWLLISAFYAVCSYF